MHERLDGRRGSVTALDRDDRREIVPPVIYVINLDRARARLAAVAAELNRVGWPFERVAAPDGQALDATALRALAPDPWSAYQARPMTPGEICCLAGHRLAWQKLIDSGLPWGLVLEDDILLGSEMAAAARVFDRQTFFDLVKLEGIVARPQGSVGARVVEGPPDIFLMETVSAGAAAYFLTREGAGKLLAITRGMNREADFFIRQYGRSGLVVGEFRPFVATQDRRESYIGAAREAGRPARGVVALQRKFVRLRESLARRLRFRRLAGGRPVVAVSREGSSASAFARDVSRTGLASGSAPLDGANVRDD